MARCLAALLSLTLAWLPLPAAGQILSGVELSAPGGDQGKFDLKLGTPELGLHADMAVRERIGGTAARSSFATTWVPLPRIDVRTVVRYSDLNSDASDPTVETRLVARPGLDFLDRVEASAHRAARRSRESLTLRFTEFSAPIDFIGGDRLGFRADVGVQKTGESSRAASNLESTLRFGPTFRVESVLNLDNAAGSGLQVSALDTRLVYGVSFGPVDLLEGRIERGLDTHRQSVGLLFSTPSVLGGNSAVNFNLERDLAATEPFRASLAYDHEWTPAPDSSVALELMLPHGTADESPSMNIAWSARF